MDFRRISADDIDAISEMSQTASEIVKEHFDPIIGPEQNDYMINKFQTASAIKEQLENDYQYYFVLSENIVIGFLAFYRDGDILHLSKFYLYKSQRGKGYSKEMLSFVISIAQREGLCAIELNVNKNNNAVYAYEKLGFKRVCAEKTDIGNGFVMDDYVYSIAVI